MSFIKYSIAERNNLLPRLMPSEISGTAYEYIMAGNGIFIRAARPEFEVLMPWMDGPIRGLAEVYPFLKLHIPRVPGEILDRIFTYARHITGDDKQPIESLFYLYYDTAKENWQLDVPRQKATRSSVIPLDTEQGSSYESALIEIHSHHDLSIGASFSLQDDLDEQNRLRLFAVVGHINQRPEIRVRVGIYGHYWEIDADQLFELPIYIKDSRDIERSNRHELKYSSTGLSCLWQFIFSRLTGPQSNASYKEEI
jgi:PRTRC genetic system protein A